MSWAEAKYIIDNVNNKTTQVGYPPKSMSSYNVQAAPGGKIKLYFRPPSNTYLKDQDNKAVPLVEVGGVMIRKKAGTPITSLDDGELFMDIPATDMFNYVTTPIVDEDVEIGTKYYYRFFPYSAVGRFNIQDNDQHGVTVTQEGSMLIFGFDQDFRDLNPGTQISYPSDCENYDYEPINVRDDDGDESTPGGWTYFLTNVLHNAPYMVKRNGEADYELDHQNYKYKINGEESDWNNTNYQGMAMSWFNRMYKKEWYTDEGNIRHVRFCEDIPVDEDEEDWIPVGCYASDVPSEDENIKKGFFIPIFSLRLNSSSATPLNNTYNDTSTIATTDVYYIYCLDYFRTIIGSNNFVGNYSNESDAFSTVFGGTVISLLRDYAIMLCKSMDLENILLNADTSTSGFNLETNYTNVPGFCGKYNGTRVFYSYVLFSHKSIFLANPYYQEKATVFQEKYSINAYFPNGSCITYYFNRGIGIGFNATRFYRNYKYMHNLSFVNADIDNNSLGSIYSDSSIPKVIINNTLKNFTANFLIKPRTTNPYIQAGYGGSSGHIYFNYYTNNNTFIVNNNIGGSAISFSSCFNNNNNSYWYYNFSDNYDDILNMFTFVPKGTLFSQHFSFGSSQSSSYPAQDAADNIIQSPTYFGTFSINAANYNSNSTLYLCNNKELPRTHYTEILQGKINNIDDNSYIEGFPYNSSGSSHTGLKKIMSINKRDFTERGGSRLDFCYKIYPISYINSSQVPSYRQVKNNSGYYNNYQIYSYLCHDLSTFGISAPGYANFPMYQDFNMGNDGDMKYLRLKEQKNLKNYFKLANAFGIMVFPANDYVPYEETT